MAKQKEGKAAAAAVATLASQLNRIGLPKHAIELTESEMSDDIKSKLVGHAHANDIRQTMREWVETQMDAGLPHPHL